MRWKLKKQWRCFNFSKIIIYVFAFVCICPHIVANKHWSHVKKSQQLIVNCTYIHQKLQFLLENIIMLKNNFMYYNKFWPCWWWSMVLSAFCWNYLDICFMNRNKISVCRKDTFMWIYDYLQQNKSVQTKHEQQKSCKRSEQILNSSPGLTYR